VITAAARAFELRDRDAVVAALARSSEFERPTVVVDDLEWTEHRELQAGAA
jgi:hypothetical protein